MLANILIFCEDLEHHRDIEEAVVFPPFQSKTDIAHWSRSHEALRTSLETVRRLSRAALQSIGSEGSGVGCGWDHPVEEGCVAPAAAGYVGQERKGTSKHSLQALNQEQRDAIVAELQRLAEITLSYLVDEEVMSRPEELVKWWPTEQDLRTAFPWTK